MSTQAFSAFLARSGQDRKGIFDRAAARLGTIASYMEKDFWVCLVLDALYHRLPAGHPRLLFRGGTSLSKAFGLIQRFSEDVDLTVYRGDLGFADQRDPAQLASLDEARQGRVHGRPAAEVQEILGRADPSAFAVGRHPPHDPLRHAGHENRPSRFVCFRHPGLSACFRCLVRNDIIAYLNIRPFCKKNI